MENNEILFKPNGLILAKTIEIKAQDKNDITASEFKLFETLLQRCQLHENFGWKQAEISRADIQLLIKNRNKITFEHIKNTLDIFLGITIKFKLNDSKGYVNSTLLAQHEYDASRDVFKITMSPNVVEALTQYKDIGYSPIDLKLVRQARGFYTQKIYGLLRMWSRHEQFITKSYDISQIKDVCDVLEGTSYDRYNNFKNKVLNPAIKEINEKLNMEVTYKEIKRVRKIQSIEFTFIDHEPRKYNFEGHTLVEAKEIIVSDEIAIANDDIDSIDYMNLIDYRLNESIHKVFLKDFGDYKNYISTVEFASEKTLGALGGKTINKRNYKYFKTTLENLLPNEEFL